ncbi:MAG: response regulator [Alphaproteobacteria bacterium]|nr:response regulator [Alphaproteobacteria bacterium]
MPARDSRRLRDTTILLVEDTYLIACEIADALRALGATVVGPASTLEAAMDFASNAALDGAVLDINMKGLLSFPVASMLAQRRIPFMFVTGYPEIALPVALRSVSRLMKPFEESELHDALVRQFSKTIDR